MPAAAGDREQPSHEAVLPNRPAGTGPAGGVRIYPKTRNSRGDRLFPTRAKLESTVRHRGIVIDDAIEIAEPTGFGYRGIVS